ncbi:MAG: hypothetical protein KF773_07220 [Deltaproteobacteria bacterium]|nr:hypothetical protein [Deltaproteobacteria bacterium]
MSFDSEQAQLAARLARAVRAMDGWDGSKTLRYKRTLGMKDAKAEFTRPFGGAASPEPDSVVAIDAPAAIKLIYLLARFGDEICINAPTARSVIGEPDLAKLVRLINEVVRTGLAVRTAPDASPLLESDRYFIVGVRVTDEGRRVLHEAIPQST